MIGLLPVNNHPENTPPNPLNTTFGYISANKGSAGIDGTTFEDIEAKEGAAIFVTGLAEAEEKEIWALQSADNSRLDECACLTMKNIGKPCAGKPHE